MVTPRTRLHRAVPSLALALALALSAPLAAELPEAGERSEIESLIAEKQFDEALGRARALRQAALERADELAEALADDLIVEGLARSGKAGADECMTLAERALELKRKLFGAGGAEAGVSLAGLGDVQLARGDLPSAIATLGEALKLLGEPGDRRVRTAKAKTLNLLAIAHFYSSSYDPAGEYWARSLAEWEGLPDSGLARAKVVGNLGNLALMRGRLPEARRRYQQGLALRLENVAPDSPALANSYATLGLVEWESANYSEAELLYEKAIELKSKTAAPPALAREINNLAILYAGIGDFRKARETLERAVRGVESTENPDMGMVMQLEGNMALMLADQGAYSEALDLADEIFEPTRAQYGNEHVAVDNLLVVRVQSLTGLKRYDEALGLAQQLLALRRKVAPEHFNIADTLADLATIETGLGRLDDSEGHFAQAIEMYGATLGSANPRMASARRRHALLLLRQGKEIAAFQEAIESERIRRDHLRLVCSSLPERQALEYARRESALDIVLSVAMGKNDPELGRAAWDALIRSRALVLEEMAQRSAAAALVDDAGTRESALALADARRELANMVVEGPGDLPFAEYRAKIEEAESVKEAAEKELASRSGLARRQLERSRLGLGDVSGNRPPESALVGFVRFVNPAPSGAPGERGSSEEYGAFVMGAKGGVHAVPLGSASEIDRLVGAWHEAVSAPDSSAAGAEASYRESAEKLRRRVWDPLKDRISGSSWVLVVPDGALATIDFATLPEGRDRYVAEEGPFPHLLASERDVVPQAAAASAGSGLLALGGAAFDVRKSGPDEPGAPGGAGMRGAGCGELASLRFEPLPASAVEAREIAETWERSGTGQPALRLTGADAGEGRLKHDAPGRRVLHLATHAFFLGGSCDRTGPGADSGKGLRGIGGVTRESKNAPRIPYENPLLLSGLALAGANGHGSGASGEEDGILTAEEIAGLNLQGVEWAVLSACDTGIGEVRAGEGVLGLSRALYVAGARTVIMSLWPVEDDLARLWMRSLYAARLAGGTSTVEAARRADLDRLRARREGSESTHPFFWAGFVAMGDWR